MSIDDYILSPKRVDGVMIAERLRDGKTIRVDIKWYDKTPLTYRGQDLWASSDITRRGIQVRELCECIAYRESIIKHEHVRFDGGAL